jgi:hypothetical protein
MSSVCGPSTAKNEFAQEPPREQFITARNEGGQFMTFGKEKPADLVPEGGAGGHGKSSDMSNMLLHIEQLESKLSQKEKQLLETQQRVEKFSARTREGMQSALGSLMKKWMDACETKDEKCKEHFKHCMEKLVANSAEENGVWQMMVAASKLHQRQEHDLDKLRVENNELKQKIDSHYATHGARTREDSLGKRKAEGEPESGEDAGSMWENFAKDCAGF